PFKAQPSERPITVRNADAETEFMPLQTPSCSQVCNLVAHFDRHSHASCRRISTRQRIVEYDKHPISSKALSRSLELVDQRADRLMIFSQNAYHLFRLCRFGKWRKVTQVAEDNRHLASMALQHALVA